MFNEGQQGGHNTVWSGGPSLVAEDLVAEVQEKRLENRYFRTSDLAIRVPEVLKLLFHETITKHFSFTNCVLDECERCSPKT